MRRKLLEAVHRRALMMISLWNRLSMKAIRAISCSLERKLYYNGEVIIAQKEIPTTYHMLSYGKV
jgi:hypothetical protein